MKKMAAQVNFVCFLMFLFSVWVAIWCLKIGTFVLIKVLLTYLLLKNQPGSLFTREDDNVDFTQAQPHY